MRKKETLQAFLSPQRLQELAGPKVYARGERYSADAHVKLLEHSRDEAIAEVMGSYCFRVIGSRWERLSPGGGERW